jgi:hypothetical protein
MISPRFMTSLAEPVQAVVSLFEGPLARVRFADVDAEGLGKLAAEVSSTAGEVAQQEARLVELKQTFAQRQEALLVLAQQALAYARIYAEGDEELTAKLNDISLPRAAKPRKVAKAAPVAEVAAKPNASEQPIVIEAAEEEAPGPPEASEAPAKTTPAYARPKIKRRLARASGPSDST